MTDIYFVPKLKLQFIERIPDGKCPNVDFQLLFPEVESDLPDDIRDDALRVFRIAVDNKLTIKVCKEIKL